MKTKDNKDRCVQICELLQKMMRQAKKSDKPFFASYIDALQAAPHYICELDPHATVEQIRTRENRDLNIFFEMPYDTLILDFPQMKNLWPNSWPFLFVQRVDEERILVQMLSPSSDIPFDEAGIDFIDEVIAAEGGDPKLIPFKEKKARWDDVQKIMPVNMDQFIVQRGKSGWHEATMAWDTYGNHTCQFARKTSGMIADSVVDFPPFYHACGLQIPGQPDCGTQYDAHCGQAQFFYQKIWELVFYTLVYIMLPPNSTVEVRQDSNRAERRRFSKRRKPGDINPFRPVYHVLYYKDVITKYKVGASKDSKSKKIFKRKPVKTHWRFLTDERYVNKRFQYVRVESRQSGSLEWTEDNQIFKVVEPPGKTALLNRIHKT